MTDLVFIDTETLSLAENTHIWEVAMLLVESDDPTQILDGDSFQIHTPDLSKADPTALKINHFFNRYDQDNAFMPIQAAVAIANFTQFAHIIGAVPNFDTERLARLLKKNGQVPTWHHHLMDVETLVLGYLKGKDPTYRIKFPWKFDEVSKDLGVEPPTNEDRHTAMGDVLWAHRTYCKVMGY